MGNVPHGGDGGVGTHKMTPGIQHVDRCGNESEYRSGPRFASCFMLSMSSKK